MDFIKYNRPAAIAVLIAVILAAVPLGALRSVSALADKVEKIYENGDERGGTVRDDLSRLADYGQNLYAIADALDCGDSTFADALSALRVSIDSPLTEENAAQALMNAASLAYNRIMALPDVPDAQKNSAISYFYEMDSTRARLQNNEKYAAAAEKYNRALESFPASLISGGRERAVLFGH